MPKTNRKPNKIRGRMQYRRNGYKVSPPDTTISIREKHPRPVELHLPRNSHNGQKIQPNIGTTLERNLENTTDLAYWQQYCKSLEGLK